MLASTPSWGKLSARYLQGGGCCQVQDTCEKFHLKISWDRSMPWCTSILLVRTCCRANRPPEENVMLFCKKVKHWARNSYFQTKKMSKIQNNCCIKTGLLLNLHGSHHPYTSLQLLPEYFMMIGMAMLNATIITQDVNDVRWKPSQ